VRSGDLCGLEIAAVDGEAGTMPNRAAGYGQLNGSRVDSGDPPQFSGAAVADYGARPTGKYGGHQPAVAGYFGAPDGVDAAVKGVKTPAPNSVLDRVAIETTLEQLAPSDDTVLSLHELPKRFRLSLFGLGVHRPPKASTKENRPREGQAGPAEGRR
jgi:hypothetical protein